MAHLSRCGLFVYAKDQLKIQRRTCAQVHRNAHQFRSDCALTSNSLSPHNSGLNGQSHTCSCFKHLGFAQRKRFRILFHTMKVGSLMCVAECVSQVPQFVEREYRRSAPVVHFSRYALRIPNSATDGFSLHRTVDFSVCSKGDCIFGFLLSVSATRCVSAV